MTHVLFDAAPYISVGQVDEHEVLRRKKPEVQEEQFVVVESRHLEQAALQGKQELLTRSL